MNSIKKYIRIYSITRIKDRLSTKINRLFKLSLKTDRIILPKNNATIGGIKLQNRVYVNEKIKTLINGDKPFMLCRLGSTEATFISKHLAMEMGLTKKVPQKYINQLKNNAGFFSAEDPLFRKRYVSEMTDAISNADILGYWGLGMQEYLCDSFCNSECILTKLTNIHPYDFDGEAWTMALKGKKVLVIHPFAKTIAQQYKKREFIWDRKDILPSFELFVLEAVQTIAGNIDPRFNNWFEALNNMFTEALKINFDIAIIGCGAYGFLLASMLKNAGKKAIHLGGVTQALFGIKGGRFDKYKAFKDFYYNDYWVRPDESEKPKNYQSIEDGCYW